MDFVSVRVESDTGNSHDNENQNSLQIKLLSLHVCLNSNEKKNTKYK